MPSRLSQRSFEYSDEEFAMRTGPATTQVTVVGVFNDRTAVARAVEALERAGFDRDVIGLASRENTDGTTDAEDTDAGEGALAGAAVGAGVGGLVGLGVVTGMIPVIGPAIAAGTLGTILMNAAGGAAVAGLAGALAGWGVSDADAEYYENQFHEGRTIVSVRADARASEARRILDDYGATRAPMAAAKRK